MEFGQKFTDVEKIWQLGSKFFGRRRAVGLQQNKALQKNVSEIESVFPNLLVVKDWIF